MLNLNDCFISMIEDSSAIEYCQRLVRLGQRRLSKLFNNVWMQRYIRIGHGAKGMLYGLIGLFLVNDIIHDQPVVSGSDGVLVALGRRPMGSIMLAFLSTGLLGYVLWRLIQAIIAPGHESKSGLRQLVQRFGYICSGVAYLSIARTAGKLAFDLAVDFNDTLDDVASVLFEVEIGPWMLLALGFGVVGIGCTYVYGALTGSYISEFGRQLDTQVARSAVLIGKVGITARGVGFILIGGYLIKAAYLVEDEPAGGLGSVFDQLDDQPLGEYWLGAIAFGFIAYAIYMIVAGVYRQFPSTEP
jgi:hypothetical protein